MVYICGDGRREPIHKRESTLHSASSKGASGTIQGMNRESEPLWPDCPGSKRWVAPRHQNVKFVIARTLVFLSVVILIPITTGACGSNASDPQVIIVSGATPAPTSLGPGSSGGSAATSPPSASPSSTSPPSTSMPSGSSGGGQVASGDSGAAAPTGVPCGVATMLAANCTGCHSDPPITGALAGLVTYADLMATSHEVPTENEAQLSLSRMTNSSSPMPPGGVLSASDVATLQNWINAGYPMGSCGSAGPSGSSPDGGADGAGAPVSPPSTTASGVFANAAAFSAGSSVSGHHNAGLNCMSSCHNHGFTFAGTLVDSTGAGVGGAEVRLVDATGQATSVYTATGSSQGNFYSTHAFVGPAHVGARNAVSTQNMLTAIQTTAQAPASTGGACNACHCTGAGCTIAPIHLP